MHGDEWRRRIVRPCICNLFVLVRRFHVYTWPLTDILSNKHPYENTRVRKGNPGPTYSMSLYAPVSTAVCGAGSWLVTSEERNTITSYPM